MSELSLGQTINSPDMPNLEVYGEILRSIVSKALNGVVELDPPLKSIFKEGVTRHVSVSGLGSFFVDLIYDNPRKSIRLSGGLAGTKDGALVIEIENVIGISGQPDVDALSSAFFADDWKPS